MRKYLQLVVNQDELKKGAEIMARFAEELQPKRRKKPDEERLYKFASHMWYVRMMTHIHTDSNSVGMSRKQAEMAQPREQRISYSPNLEKYNKLILQQS